MSHRRTPVLSLLLLGALGALGCSDDTSNPGTTTTGGSGGSTGTATTTSTGGTGGTPVATTHGPVVQGLSGGTLGKSQSYKMRFAVGQSADSNKASSESYQLQCVADDGSEQQ